MERADNQLWPMKLFLAMSIFMIGSGLLSMTGKQFYRQDEMLHFTVMFQYLTGTIMFVGSSLLLISKSQSLPRFLAKELRIANCFALITIGLFIFHYYFQNYSLHFVFEIMIRNKPIMVVFLFLSLLATTLLFSVMFTQGSEKIRLITKSNLIPFLLTVLYFTLSPILYDKIWPNMPQGEYLFAGAFVLLCYLGWHNGLIFSRPITKNS